ncbi:MAG: hypothetical protein HN368_20070 [Spirochaetales bacterium]|nr:hypothetical protein [Spirochaetales bacterium]
MDPIIRKYSEKKDKKAARRIWTECGWLSDDKKEKEAFDLFISSSPATVFEHAGAAECLVLSTPARLRYLEKDLSYSAITGVTTSRIARNLGAASLTLAQALRQDVEAGAVVSGLGIFEQGFYNRLGYGSGNYEHWLGFDPAWLVALPKPEVPSRFDVSNWKAIHQARLNRRKSHGAVDLLPPEVSRTDMMWLKNSFALGYKKGGRITHCVVMHASELESGPYSVSWMSYQNLRQFRELLAVIRSLGDQVRQIRMREPQEIQMQDFIRKPFQLQSITKSGKYEAGSKAFSYWQMRILQLKPCIAAIKCRDDLQFNLTIEDPIGQFLPKGTGWKGCQGEYTVTFGSKSSIKKGFTAGLDTLTATIGDFTRYWLGVLSAEALNISGKFDGPDDLLKTLDRINPAPTPAPEWDY